MVYQAVRLPRGNGSSRLQRKFSILTALYDSGDWLSTYDVGRRIGLVPSEHLRGLLKELLNDSFVLHESVRHRANVYKSMWRLADNARYSTTWRAAFDAYIHGLEALEDGFDPDSYGDKDITEDLGEFSGVVGLDDVSGGRS